MTTNLYAQCPICQEVFRRDGTGETLEEKNAYWALKAHMTAAHDDAMFWCPRQAESRLTTPGSKGAFWKTDGTCSYCGSLSPDQFFAAIEAGAEVGPTDKNYKAYVSGEGTPRTDGAAKFYYQHLDQAGRNRFIDLFNAKKMKIGEPGYFYVTPFFCAPVADP